MDDVLAKGKKMGSKGVVLAVDDDPLNLELIEELLDEVGYEVHLAKDGTEALAWLEKNPTLPDVVLLDRMMPGLDGIEVLKQMKQSAQLDRIPVIFQTAKSSEDAVREGLEAGAFYYITKPFNEDALLAVVATACEEHRAYSNLLNEVRKTVSGLKLMQQGVFELRTLEQMVDLTGLLSTLCPHPESVVVGLYELLINAVEHGNLGITYREKSQLNLEGRWHEEVERRLNLPQFAERKVRIEYGRDTQHCYFIIQDEGNGFDWEQYLEFSPERAFDTHGRGIAMSKLMSFSKLTYMGNGNTVRAEIALDHEA
ncbi:response regulator receiver protein [Magnetococcus marinus MC-1]|uniref:Response regulator receiver protein n=2 Tax=Magnetococcus TaxID=162171 RepID=A0L7V3_MAGMM|nr:response regulator receiver protein [Magnetococcus marinus MC-1]